jgi:LuxR family transcriptional regulator, positive regulator of biofilm formation
MSEISEKYAMIYLIGLDNSFNGALSYVFEREVCSKCTILKNGDSIPIEESSSNTNKILILLDGRENDIEKELITLGEKVSSRSKTITVVLFNLQKGTGVERKAFIRGIRGFFYRDDSLSHMLKGIRSLLQGETWISRDVLLEVALQSRVKMAKAADEKIELTHRETEILAFLSIGSSNDDIAERLFISSNTVKTHLYRIFRKIKVPNRFQAALWAAKNL